GKLENLECSIKTYLFAIGKNLTLKIFSKRQREIVDVNRNHIIPDIPGDSEESENFRQKVVMKVMEHLGEPCKSLLEAFYFRSLSMHEIAIELAYKNADVVKSQKARCMNEVKKQVKKKLQNNQID